MNQLPRLRQVGDPIPLTRDDMSRLFEPAYRAVIPADKLRHSHHRIARMAAAGLRPFEIAEKTGYSPTRLTVLLNSPAMEDLIAKYREMVDKAFERGSDEYMSVATRNMIRAENMLADRLDESEDDDGMPISTKDLLAISRDGADRFGYGKKSMVFNPGSDFAALLEKAIARSDAAKPSDMVEIEADA